MRDIIDVILTHVIMEFSIFQGGASTRGFNKHHGVNVWFIFPVDLHYRYKSS